MIESFKHKGLEELFRTGKSSRIGGDMAKRVMIRLQILNGARNLGDLSNPGLRCHPLKGFKPPRHAIWVNGPWRITFEWTGGTARLVDLEQYHDRN